VAHARAFSRAQAWNGKLEKRKTEVFKVQKRVEIALPEKLYEKVKGEVEAGNYATITDVIRTALRKLLEQEQ